MGTPRGGKAGSRSARSSARRSRRSTGSTGACSNGSRTDPLDPVFLEIDDVLEIHRDQVARYGGSPGIRDEDLLESAVAQAAATFAGEYLHNDIFQMAAAYLFHIAQNHPFVDGNKRTGTVAAIAFLEMNGFLVEADATAFEGLVCAVAEGRVGKNGIADFLRANSRQSG